MLHSMALWLAIGTGIPLCAACAHVPWGRIDPNTALKAGDPHVAFELPDADGNLVASEALLAEGPTVVVLYRGWSSKTSPLQCAVQLGELSHELDAFTARGVKIVGISADSPETSRAAAERVGIEFPLLEDRDGSIIRAYSGLEADGSAIPAVFIIDKDGGVLFVRYSDAWKDRVSIRTLLAAIDRATPPVSAVPALKGGYRPPERVQLNVGAGFAMGFKNLDDERWWGAGDLSVTGLFPLGRNVMVGPSIRAVLGERSMIDVGGALKVRAVLDDCLAELFLTPAFGLSVGLNDGGSSGWYFGASLGTQTAIAQNLAISAQTTVSYHDFGSPSDFTGWRYVFEIGLTFLL